MPITSLTCTSRQARTQRLHWMQASRLTAIAGWLRSGTSAVRRGNLLAVTFCRSAVFQNSESASCATFFGGWSVSSSSTTILRAVLAWSLWVLHLLLGDCVGLELVGW